MTFNGPYGSPPMKLVKNREKLRSELQNLQRFPRVVQLVINGKDEPRRRRSSAERLIASSAKAAQQFSKP